MRKHNPYEDEQDDQMPRRRAGLLPDELAPGETNQSHADDDIHAAGTPGGGAAGGGLAGTNAADGSLDDDVDLEDAMGSGFLDNSGDTRDENEPQAGHSGGAVGGTPAGKRVTPHHRHGISPGNDSGRDGTIGTNPHK